MKLRDIRQAQPEQEKPTIITFNSLSPPCHRCVVPEPLARSRGVGCACGKFQSLHCYFGTSTKQKFILVDTLFSCLQVVSNSIYINMYLWNSLVNIFFMVWTRLDSHFFWFEHSHNVGKYTIHGWYGTCGWLSGVLC